MEITAFQQKSIEQQTLEVLLRMEELLQKLVDNTRPSVTKASYGKHK